MSETPLKVPRKPKGSCALTKSSKKMFKVPEAIVAEGQLTRQLQQCPDIVAQRRYFEE
jgi:hypothetical protein